MQYLVAPATEPHKILGLTRKLALFVGIAVCLAIFGYLQAQKVRFVLLPGTEVHFVDADCYSRMDAARIISENPGTLVTRHAFENYPLRSSSAYDCANGLLRLGFGRLLAPESTWISPANMISQASAPFSSFWQGCGRRRSQCLSLEHDGASNRLPSNPSRASGRQTRSPVPDLTLDRKRIMAEAVCGRGGRRAFALVGSLLGWRALGILV